MDVNTRCSRCAVIQSTIVREGFYLQAYDAKKSGVISHVSSATENKQNWLSFNLFAQLRPADQHDTKSAP